MTTTKGDSMTTDPPTSRSSAARVLCLAACLGLLALAPISVLLYRLRYDGNLPDPLPTHWGPDGQVDGTTSLASFTLISAFVTAGVVVIGVAALLLLRHRATVALPVVVASTWVGWMVATTYASALSAANSAATADDVSLPAALVIAVLMVPTLVALAVWLLVPFRPQASAIVSVPPTPVALRAGERVTWVGQSSSVWMLGAGALLVVAAVATVFVLWPVAVVLGLVGLTLAWAHTIHVRVDNRAVTVGWGPTRWPRTTVPLSEVAAAQAMHIDPLAWGGWGYRVTPRGHAAVTRSGPGLVLSRHEAAPLAVTVDDPQAAADVINAIVLGGPAVDVEPSDSMSDR